MQQQLGAFINPFRADEIYVEVRGGRESPWWCMQHMAYRVVTQHITPSRVHSVCVCRLHGSPLAV